jgi:hypothetical protein
VLEKICGLIERVLSPGGPANKANGADGRFKAFIARFGFYWELMAAAHWRALERSLKTRLNGKDKNKFFF